MSKTGDTVIEHMNMERNQGPMVVNVRTAAPGTYIYVGRACYRGSHRFPESIFHNPFRVATMTWKTAMAVLWMHTRKTWVGRVPLGGVVDHTAAIELFRAYVQSKPDLLAQARRELKGKNLGCWCHPYPCHAQVLLEIANADVDAGPPQPSAARPSAS